MIIEKRKVVVFSNPSKTKMYFTDKKNFDNNIFDGNKCVELESFLDLDDAKDYLERVFGFEVEIKF